MSSATEKTRVAFVGAGAMGREHVRAFASIPEVEVTGIHSRTREKAEALAGELGIPTVCDSVGELYEATQADLVVAAVPEMSALKVSQAIFEHPWSAMMEKPIGYCLEEAEVIANSARELKRDVYCGLNRRFMSSTQAAAMDVDQSDLPRFIHVQDQQDFATAEVIGHPAEVVENWMYANSIHLVDYLTCFGRGKVTRVDPILPWKGRETEIVMARVTFDSGDVGIYEGLWKGPGPWAVRVQTTEKRWEMRPLEKAVYQNAGERSLNEVPVASSDEEYKPGFRLQAEECVKAVRGEASSMPTIDEALESMRLVSEIYSESAGG